MYSYTVMMGFQAMGIPMHACMHATGSRVKELENVNLSNSII